MDPGDAQFDRIIIYQKVERSKRSIEYAIRHLHQPDHALIADPLQDFYVAYRI